MIKKQKYLHLTFVLIGIGILLIFALTNDGSYQSGLLCGLGSSLMAIGILRTIKLRRLTSSPEKAEEYIASQSDERVHFLAQKARGVTFVISLYAQLAAGLSAQFFFGQKLMGMVLCCSVCIQSLLFAALYYYYAKKY